MKTPIDQASEPSPHHTRDTVQYRVLGSQAIIYGGFIYLLLLIPNSVTARLCILFCATLMAGAGVVMRVMARRVDRATELAGLCRYRSGSAPEHLGSPPDF